MKIRNNRASE